MSLFDFLRPKETPVPSIPRGAFSTDCDPQTMDAMRLEEALKREEIFARVLSSPKFKSLNRDGTENKDVKQPTFAMDASNGQGGESVKWMQNVTNAVPFTQLAWFANQTFIGYQAAALMSQNWLINKCCSMPARDAVRHGYEITVNNGQKADPETLAKIRQLDKQYGTRNNLIQYVRYGRIFGIRVAMFIIKGADEAFYLNPFNIDGVKKGSYVGISQIDPYWITPELDFAAGSDPASIHFYEPTWWRVNGKRVHRTHLMIYRPFDVPDILKPVYWYGGIPLPQLVAERVYAAEKVANEAPMLSLSKRTMVIKTDAAQALSNQVKFDERMNLMAALRNNYGTQILDRNDEAQQFDTTLADFDALIMTQYQLVAAASGVPATKLLGTSPKGFNATGEFEMLSYHQELETIQMNDMEPLLDRHYLLLAKSEGLPEIQIAWNAVDSPTGKSLAEINFIKSQTAVNENAVGAVDGQDERERLMSDKFSGYNTLGDREIAVPEKPTEEDEEGSEPLEDEKQTAKY
jgi:uncharacterized protein